MKDAVSAKGFVAFEKALREKEFPIPLLLLYAKTDPLVSPKNCDVLAKLVPAAKVAWIDASSHFAHVDTPDAVVSAVTEFFGQT